MLSFAYKLQVYRSWLSAWQQLYISQFLSNLHVIQQQLEDIYSCSSDPNNAILEAQLLTELHDLWSCDELHWK